LGVEEPAIRPEALELLGRHTWPGNVRELENTVRKALLLSRGYAIDAGMIQSALAPGASPAATGGEGLPSAQQIGQLLEAARRGELSDVHRRVIERVERELLAQAMALAEGNLTRAAAWLGITRLTLREKLAAFGLRPAN
jgi:DNA-binding NtrC family response regulator